MPSSEAKTRFGQLLDEVEKAGQRFIVDRRGKPVAVILNFDDYEEFLEVLGEQSDPSFQKHLRESWKQYRLGKVVKMDELWKLYRQGKADASR